MLSVANPVFLYLLPLVLLPLIIHLFGIKRPIRIVFAPMPILLMIRNKVVRKKRLHSILLIILRILLLLLITLGFAGLYIRFSKEVSHIDGRCLLMIDNSPSSSVRSDGMTILENIYTEIENYINNNRSFCKVLDVYSLSDKKNVAISLSGDKEVGLKNIVKPSAQVVKIGRDISYVLSKIKKEDYEKIILAADLFSHSIDDIDKISKIMEDYNINLIAGNKRTISNGYIERIKVSVGGERDWLLKANVANGGEDAFYGQVELSEGGKIIGSKTVSVAPDSSIDVDFVLPANEDEKTARYLRISIKGDDFDYDNEEYVFMREEYRYKILLVNGEPSSIENKSEIFYLKKALSIYFAEAAQVVTVLEDMVPQNCELYDIIVFANVSTFENSVRDTLEKYLRSGGKILFTLGGRVNLAEYNRLGLLPARINELYSSEKSDSILISGDSFFADNLDMSRLFKNVRLKSYYDVIPNRNAKVILKTSSERPILITEKIGQGMVGLLTTSIDADMNDWPLKKSYIPFIAYLFKNMIYGLSNKIMIYAIPNEEISFVMSPCQNGGILFNGTRQIERDLACRISPQGISLATFSAPSDIGFYRAGLQDMEITVAVNADKSESDLRNIDISSLAKRSSKEEGRFIKLSKFSSSEDRAYLIDILLVLSAIVLILEMVVMNRK